MPLQHGFSSCIPNDAALDALAAIGMPILELGAGAGYWGAMLRQRAVECVLFDREPPTADGNNLYFNTQFTEVLRGDHTMASNYPEHALMLCWPYSDEEAEAPWAKGKMPWDVLALRNYAGSTVAHIGDLNEEADKVTTSLPFKRLLTAPFQQVATVPLPRWLHCADSLTIC